MANAATLNQNYKNFQESESTETSLDNNRDIIQINDPRSSYTTPVPVTTYRPSSSPNYIEMPSSPSTPAENYQSPITYQLENYQAQNDQLQNFQSLRLRYNMPEVNSYTTEGESESRMNNVAEKNFVESGGDNSMMNVEQIMYSNVPQQSDMVNPSEYSQGISKTGYAVVSNASPNSVNVNNNEYVEPGNDNAFLFSRGFSSPSTINQKPLANIPFSLASDVSHVSYSGGNGQVYYNW